MKIMWKRTNYMSICIEVNTQWMLSYRKQLYCITIPISLVANKEMFNVSLWWWYLEMIERYFQYHHISIGICMKIMQLKVLLKVFCSITLINYHCYLCTVYKIFFCFFTFLLTAAIVESSHILAGIYFVFLKDVLDQTLKTFDTKFGPQWKDQ